MVILDTETFNCFVTFIIPGSCSSDASFSVTKKTYVLKSVHVLLQFGLCLTSFRFWIFGKGAITFLSVLLLVLPGRFGFTEDM